MNATDALLSQQVSLVISGSLTLYSAIDNKVLITVDGACSSIEVLSITVV